MPFAENQGARIYWDADGAGAPLLMIMGMGGTTATWHRSRPVLASRCRTIAFDNRGVGRTGVPPGPYSIPQMASDAAAVLDSASVRRAHVFGISMGGMIAQEFALQYPQRVSALVLACTSPGGPDSFRAEPEVLRALSRRDIPPEAASRAMWPYVYSPSTPAERREEDLAVRMKSFTTDEGRFLQMQAVKDWEAYSRLDRITAPTLVIHGELDQLIPPGNAPLIAARIAGAKLVMVPQASHTLWTDQPETFHGAILEFLAANDALSKAAR